MANFDEGLNKRERIETQENRPNIGRTNMPENTVNQMETSDFLKEQIGKLIRVEFLVGTNNMVERVGILENVASNYILLRTIDGDNIIYADIFSIKFVTVSNIPFMGNPYGQVYNQRYY